MIAQGRVEYGPLYKNFYTVVHTPVPVASPIKAREITFYLFVKSVCEKK